MLAVNNEDVEVAGIQMKSKNNAIQISALPDKENICHLDQVLYTKEKYGISDAAYHALTQSDPSLPRTCQMNRRKTERNCRCDVYPTPEGTTGVQQSLRVKLRGRIELLVEKNLSTSSESKVDRVKLSSDGTWIGSRLHVVAFGSQ